LTLTKSEPVPLRSISLSKGTHTNSSVSGQAARKAIKMTFEEHRVHPRASLKWSVSLEIEGKITEGVTKNISEGGAYVCCATPLGPKAEFFMVINAPDKQLNVKAEVVWANTYSLNDEITPMGMGVRFMDITGEDRGIIAKAVAEHLAKNEGPEDLQASMLDTLEIE
jgi:hypothetical protein